MARRRARKDDLLPALFVLGVVLYVLPNWLSRISLLAFLIALWLGFFKKTTCDVKNFSAPGYCHRDCRGILRACSLSSHKREKKSDNFGLARHPVVVAQEGSVASLAPSGTGRVGRRKLAGCADLEPLARTPTGQRSPGSGSHRR